jgi:hypothetical protein
MHRERACLSGLSAAASVRGKPVARFGTKDG